MSNVGHIEEKVNLLNDSFQIHKSSLSGTKDNGYSTSNDQLKRLPAMASVSKMLDNMCQAKKKIRGRGINNNI